MYAYFAPLKDHSEPDQRIQPSMTTPSTVRRSRRSSNKAKVNYSVNRNQAQTKGKKYANGLPIAHDSQSRALYT